MTVPLEPVADGDARARVCVRVEGSGPRPSSTGRAATVRLEWLRPGSESWLDVLPVVARRFGYGKANPFGSALLLRRRAGARCSPGSRPGGSCSAGSCGA